MRLIDSFLHHACDLHGILPIHGIPGTLRDLSMHAMKEALRNVCVDTRIEASWESLRLPNKYRVTLASQWFGPIYMIDSQRVISAGSNIGDYVIYNIVSVEPFLRKRGEMVKRKLELTIVKIGQLRIHRPLNNGELYLVELFALEAYSFR